MKRAILRRSVPVICFAIVCLLSAERVLGLTTYVVGRGGGAWEERAEEFDRVSFDGETLRPVRVDPEVPLHSELAPFGNIYTSVYYVDGVADGTTALDGDPTTALERIVSLAGGGRASGGGGRRITSMVILYVDLGAPYTVNRIRFYPREEYMHRFIIEYGVWVSDGIKTGRFEWNPRSNETLWTRITRTEANEDPAVDIEIEPQLVRYVALDPNPFGKNVYVTSVNDKNWEIAEFEVYGQDYVPRASYTSEIIDFDELASWGKIRWAGERHGDAKVLIRTRAGLDDDPNVYWKKTGTRGEQTNLTEDGRLITKSEYDKMPLTERGQITYDTENWSFWSAPYDFEEGTEGVPVSSPGPRQYFQFRVDFLPTPNEGAEIETIEFELSSPPAAQNVIAEIFPIEVRPNEMTPFTYAVLPTIQRGDTGFDGLTIETPSKVTEIRTVRIDGADVDFSVRESTEKQFSVTFPRVEVDGTLVEVEFDARVFTYGTLFNGWVFDSKTKEVPQLVNPGDATLDLEGNDLAVRTELDVSLITDAGVTPNPFTPNGDAANDETAVTYTLLQLVHPAPVSVEIYDLYGRLIRTLYTGLDVAGRYTQLWDGRDDDDLSVSPGIYVCRIEVESDRRTEQWTGIVAVAY